MARAIERLRAGQTVTPLTESILAGIATDNDEAFLGAEETAMAFAFGTGPNVGLIDPYDRLLKEAPPGQEDIEAIKSALIAYLQSGVSRYAASAVFALGKISDPGLVPFLRDQLQAHLTALMNQNAIVGNLLCALDNNGERVTSGRGYGILEIDKNVADARTYLQRFGVLVPW